MVRERVLVVGLAVSLTVVFAAIAWSAFRPAAQTTGQLASPIIAKRSDPNPTLLEAPSVVPVPSALGGAGPGESASERVSAAFVPGLSGAIADAPATPWSPGERQYFSEQLDSWRAQFENPRLHLSEAEIGNEARRRVLTDEAVDDAGRQLIAWSFTVFLRTDVSWLSHSSEPHADRYAPRDQYQTVVDGRVHAWSAQQFPLEAQLVDECETLIADGSSSIFQHRPLRREAVLGIEALARERLKPSR